MVHLKDHTGKPSALNAGMRQATGEIVVFADVRQTFNRDAIRRLVENFADRSVGAVTGQLVLLTEETAGHLGVTNRLDAAESIDGGTRYLQGLITRMPSGVTEPDRLWMALAAYNIGIHHLEDARILTQKQGRDPNKWNDVMNYLPWLADAAWHPKTKYGYARGMEAVQFVNRVRVYYDVLVKIDEEEKARSKPKAFDLKAPAI